jgi:hypothetical protein
MFNLIASFCGGFHWLLLYGELTREMAKTSNTNKENMDP